MKVIKKINNNVAICVDANGNELIAFGKGIGFQAIPYEVTDLRKIDRTFYGINSNYVDLLTEIPEDIFEISAKIVDYTKTIIHTDINPNIVFTLADHIQFAIHRYQNSINMKMPFIHDIEHLYEKEMNIGKKAIIYINKTKNIHLPGYEAAGIALHIINSENFREPRGSSKNEKQVELDITKIVEKHFAVKINKRSFNYSRFVTHLQYLMKRGINKSYITTQNKRMFDTIRREYPKTYQCVIEVKLYIQDELNLYLNDEELLYLMLHVNRLCTREDCNQ